MVSPSEFLTSFKTESGQFVIYVASLIAALAVNNIIQEELKTKPLGTRVGITIGIIIFSLFLVTLVSLWIKPLNCVLHVNDIGPFLGSSFAR